MSNSYLIYIQLEEAIAKFCGYILFNYCPIVILIYIQLEEAIAKFCGYI
ncbi:hypothetical protein [Okeania sp. SIO2B3]|nr:hypothetical protein [Okeania sp. SIO2B3]NET41003.1 hypothetical protein [Okeania sp. SIO2B3]